MRCRHLIPLMELELGYPDLRLVVERWFQVTMKWESRNLIVTHLCLLTLLQFLDPASALIAMMLRLAAAWMALWCHVPNKAVSGFVTDHRRTMLLSEACIWRLSPRPSPRQCDRHWFGRHTPPPALEGRFSARMRCRMLPSLWSVCSAVEPTALAARAATTLILSAAGGYMAERQVSNSGILVTLVLAAVASNVIKLAPSHHALYDVCWSTIVPMSLALLLLSLAKSPPSTQNVTISSSMANESLVVASAVIRLAIPFGLACLGSILGCTVAYSCCRKFSGWTPELARRAAACLAASFTGGSVNFLATAAILQSGTIIATDPLATATATTATLVSAMASADVVIMALYFAGLSVALQSPRLQQWFLSNQATNVTLAHSEDSLPGQTDLVLPNDMANVASLVPTLFVRGRAMAGLLVCLLAFGIVQIARGCERLVHTFVPATACAFVVAVTLLVSRIVPSSSQPPWLVRLWNEMRRCAEPWSEICFLLLFAAIGVAANVLAALRHGPSCCIFTLLALSVHSVFTIASAILFQRFMGTKRPNLSLQLADVLVASNAAIGGPATAAAFCSQVKGGSAAKKALTVSATVWGVVGYAIGTTIGVSLYNMLPMV
jgi:uncharacterized membrane protein